MNEQQAQDDYDPTGSNSNTLTKRHSRASDTSSAYSGSDVMMQHGGGGGSIGRAAGERLRIGGVGGGATSSSLATSSAAASTCSGADDDVSDGVNDRDSLDLNGLAETLVDSDDEEGYDDVSSAFCL